MNALPKGFMLTQFYTSRLDVDFFNEHKLPELEFLKNLWGLGTE
jgi:hypothetical protein